MNSKMFSWFGLLLAGAALSEACCPNNNLRAPELNNMLTIGNPDECTSCGFPGLLPATFPTTARLADGIAMIQNLLDNYITRNNNNRAIEVPRVPSIPAVPSIHPLRIPAVPEIPRIPSVPVVPSIQPLRIPAIPEIPPLPAIPALPRTITITAS